MLTDISRLLSLALKFETVLRSRSMANLPAVNFVVTTNKTLTDPEIAHFMGAFDKHSILDRYEYLVSKSGFEFELSFKVDAKQEHEIAWASDIDKHAKGVILDAPDVVTEVVEPEEMPVVVEASAEEVLDAPQEEETLQTEPLVEISEEDVHEIDLSIGEDHAIVPEEHVVPEVKAEEVVEEPAKEEPAKEEATKESEEAEKEKDSKEAAKAAKAKEKEEKEAKKKNK